MSGNRSRRNRHRAIKFVRSFLITLFVIGILVVAFFVVKKGFSQIAPVGEQEEAVDLPRIITVDGINIADYTEEELKKELMKRHPWSLCAIGDYDTCEFDNIYETRLDRMLDEAFSEPEEDKLVTDFDEESASEAASTLMAVAVSALEVQVSGNEVMVYNADTDSFEYNDPKAERLLDEEALRSDIKAALLSGDFTARIEAKSTSGELPYRAEDFRLIGSYVTHTTANNDRNTNVRLSCEAVNGKILQPGERFSYNETLGKRTAEKGYKEAGAYANGEHVTELGGGVCQLSSTMYNATIAANLQVDERTGHTYEPTYVTPGEDATVSYSKPDFAFTNSTPAPIGLSAHYADRTVTVEIYGLPQLDEGVKRHLRSEKIGQIDPPMPNYVEDPTIFPGFEDIVKQPKYGSKWKTYIVLEKDGEVISEEYLHTTSYKGEPATIRRNLAGLAALGLAPAPDGAAPAAPAGGDAPEAGE